MFRFFCCCMLLHAQAISMTNTDKEYFKSLPYSSDCVDYVLSLKKFLEKSITLDKYVCYNKNSMIVGGHYVMPVHAVSALDNWVMPNGAAFVNLGGGYLKHKSGLLSCMIEDIFDCDQSSSHVLLEYYLLHGDQADNYGSVWLVTVDSLKKTGTYAPVFFVSSAAINVFNARS